MNPLPHKLHVIPHVVLMLFGNFWQYPRDFTDWQESRSYTSAHMTESNKKIITKHQENDRHINKQFLNSEWSTKAYYGFW